MTTSSTTTPSADANIAKPIESEDAAKKKPEKKTEKKHKPVAAAVVAEDKKPAKHPGITRSRRCNLDIPIGRVEKEMRDVPSTDRISENAVIATAAIMQTVAEEVYKKTGAVTIEEKRAKMRPEHMVTACSRDEELHDSVLKDVILASVHTMPENTIDDDEKDAMIQKAKEAPKRRKKSESRKINKEKDAEKLKELKSLAASEKRRRREKKALKKAKPEKKEENKKKKESKKKAEESSSSSSSSSSSEDEKAEQVKKAPKGGKKRPQKDKLDETKEPAPKKRKVAAKKAPKAAVEEKEEKEVETSK
jgi:translation initiation factor IF-2